MDIIEVSIQIPTWKRKEKLENLLNSLIDQTFPLDKIEILICDSYSNDGTQEMLQKYYSKFKCIKYLNIEINTLSAKRNFMFNYTKADIIITIDDDITVNKDFIREHYYSQKAVSNTIFCGKVEFPNSWIDRSNYYRYRNEKHMLIDTKYQNHQLMGYNNIVVMNMSCKKSELVKLGFMNEKFIKYGGEDQEFAWKLIKNQFAIRYLKKAVVTHFEDSSLDGYLKKLYVSARYGLTNLILVHPDILNQNSKSNFLIPRKIIKLSFLKSIKRLIINLILNRLFFDYIKFIVKKVDTTKVFYFYFLYEFLCAYSLKQGYNDINKTDNQLSSWI